MFCCQESRMKPGKNFCAPKWVFLKTTEANKAHCEAHKHFTVTSCAWCGENEHAAVKTCVPLKLQPHKKKERKKKRHQRPSFQLNLLEAGRPSGRTNPPSCQISARMRRRCCTTEQRKERWRAVAGTSQPSSSLTHTFTRTQVWLSNHMCQCSSTQTSEVSEERRQSAKATTELPPEVAPKVSHDVRVRAFLHHEDFLLNDGKVIAWEQREKTRTHGQAVSTFGSTSSTSDVRRRKRERNKTLSLTIFFFLMTNWQHLRKSSALEWPLLW